MNKMTIETAKIFLDRTLDFNLYPRYSMGREELAILLTGFAEKIGSKHQLLDRLDEATINRAAKAVAEYRQHGCHYAEGTCDECSALAKAVLTIISLKTAAPLLL